MSDNPEMQMIMLKLDMIDQKVDAHMVISKENQRSLRGYNNTPGLVAVVGNCETQLTEISEDVCEIEKTLHGEGEDKIGIVGEFTVIKRLNKWLIGLATGAIGAAIGLIIKSFSAP